VEKMEIKMRFAVDITPDKLYHVTNMVMGRKGQHHVHTKEGYEQWKHGIADDDIFIGEAECDCGLKPGDVKEYDGHTWHNYKFDK